MKREVLNIYFENIRAVNPTQNLDSVLNVWIKNGTIVHCSEKKPDLDEDAKVVKSDNLVCSPGFFDMHVHFREPGFEYKENTATGAEAAANGGFTGVCIMPNTEPAIDNITVVDYINQRAKDLLADVKIGATITQNREGGLLSPMLELNDFGVVLFTNDGSCIMNSEVMKRAFDYASTLDLLISQHCEDHKLTQSFAMNDGYLSGKLGLKGYPTVAEEIIVARDIKLAEYCGNTRYHIQHISSKGSIQTVRNAKDRGLRVSCEVAPHHFSLSEEYLKSYDSNYKMNPPLRSKEDIDAILEGLKDGTIDCIASDHAPHASHEKEAEFDKAPYGIIGLETSLGVSITHLLEKDILTLPQLIHKMSIRPRQLLKLPEINIKEGEKANLTIFAPREEWIYERKSSKSKSGNSPFIDEKLIGKPKYAINNGKIYESSL